MKVCILGCGLTSLVLAKLLVRRGVIVDIFFENEPIKDKNRTLGISKANVEFFNKEILNIEKLIWKINKIEVFSEGLNNEKILNFENNEQELFSIIRYNELRNKLLVELKKKKFFNIKKKNVTEDLFKKKYNLIFNCESHNFITKKFFSKQIKKDYKSFAHTAIIKHKRKEKENKVAVQIFTLNGPIAFLPISETETSVVYSTKNKKKIDLRKEIKRFNTQYKILKITKPSFFQLKLVNLRIYKYKNILAFGDLLHKIHPLAGQGFNMNLRDLKEILSLIDLRISNGLQLDSSICKDFEKKTRHRNYLFSNGIDLIYEIFNLESKLKKKIISRYIQILGKNKILNNFFKSIADKGLRV